MHRYSTTITGIAMSLAALAGAMPPDQIPPECLAH